MRANSIDKMEIRNPGVQRAVSTAALMAGRRVLRPDSTQNVRLNSNLK